MRNSGVELAVTNSEKTDVKTNERHTQQNEPSTTKGNFHTVKFPIPKKQDVFNEFEENPFLFYSAFPFIFLLGKGLQKKGTLPKVPFQRQRFHESIICAGVPLRDAIYLLHLFP